MTSKKAKAKSALFEYVATDESGRVITGTSDAASEQALVRRLREKGYRVQKVTRSGHKVTQGKDDSEPIRRVVQVIVEQALKDRAAAIRVVLSARKIQGRVRVWYLIGETWHEVMSVPDYVWPPLRSRFAEMAGVILSDDLSRQSGQISFLYEGADHVIGVTFFRKSIRLNTVT